MVKKILVIAGALAVLCVGIIVYGTNMAQRLPVNNTKAFLSSKVERQGKKVLVCVGDSITQSSVSHNYVDMIARETSADGLIVVNAGINSELAYNVLMRIDDIVRCKPDFVTILIGTNDANSSLSPENSARNIKNMKLPRTPDKVWFAENLAEICRILKTKTTAKIALLSLPPIGENPDTPSFQASDEYSAVIRDTARREGCAYLPLNEKMTAFLKENPRPPQHSYSEGRFLMYAGFFEHFIFGMSFDKISEKNGFLLLTDFLHLNGRAAGMVTELISGFIGEK